MAGFSFCHLSCHFDSSNINIFTVVNNEIKTPFFFFFLNQCVHTGSLIITTLSSFSGLFLVGLLHLSLCLSFFFFFHANFSLFIPDNYDLVGVGGADGGAQA